jgi:Fe-Mn family superoxide dismutase
MDNFATSRRSFLAGAAAVVAAAWAVPVVGQTQTTGSAAAGSDASDGGPFKLPPLPYAYEALEPHIDVQTMRLHHDKHHAGYVSKLNDAIAKESDLKSKSVEELLKDIDSIPESIRTDVRNNGGGHANHTMFWETMTPGGAKAPTGELAEAINAKFESFDNFKKAFEEAGTKRFGSGWVWLVKPEGESSLDVISTANQDSPLMEGHQPILGNDVWEHAYYLKYQNKRGDYLKAWWNLVNWDKVAERFAALK